MSKKDRPIKHKPRGTPPPRDVPQLSPSLLARAREKNLPADKVMTSDEFGLERLSERIVQLAEAIRQWLGNPHFQPSTFVKIAAQAWNIAHIPDRERRSLIRRAAVKLFPDIGDRIFLASLVRFGVKWKLAHFPDDHRIVTDFEVTESGDGSYIVNVMSLGALPRQKAPDEPGNQPNENQSRQGEENASE